MRHGLIVIPTRDHVDHQTPSAPPPASTPAAQLSQLTRFHFDYGQMYRLRVKGVGTLHEHEFCVNAADTDPLQPCELLNSLTINIGQRWALLDAHAVEIVPVNEQNEQHLFHLHDHWPWVVGHRHVTIESIRSNTLRAPKVEGAMLHDVYTTSPCVTAKDGATCVDLGHLVLRLEAENPSVEHTGEGNVAFPCQLLSFLLRLP